MKVFSVLLLLLFAGLNLYAEEPEEVAGAAVLQFPLAPVLEIVRLNEVSWRPDWPLSPGVFEGPPARELRVILPGEEPQELVLSRDGEGQLLEFPLPVNGVLVQAIRLPKQTAGDERPSFKVQMPDGEWGVFILKSFDEESFYEALFGEEKYYVFIKETEQQLNETWYDSEGNPYGFFVSRRALVAGRLRLRSITGGFSGGEFEQYYDFDSNGNITAVETKNAGEEEALRYSALYGKTGLPVYWKLPAEDLSVQWDEEGLLLRIWGEKTDCRYEHGRDGRGNWTKRREILMKGTFGALFPALRGEMERRIDYGEEED